MGETGHIETAGLAERRVVRLKPRARRLRAPWAYVDEVVLDRRTRAIPPGSVVELQDAERRPLGAAAFNAASKIAVGVSALYSSSLAGPLPS